MLDIRLIREQPDLVKAALGRTGVDPAQVDAVLAYDEQRRALLREVEQLKALRNAVSKEIGKNERCGRTRREDRRNARRR